MSKKTKDLNGNIKMTVNRIISGYIEEEPDYIALMQEIQDKFNYLPKDALKLCAEKLNVPLSRLYSLATFYSCFSLTPKGKYEIHVCLGTACHVRKAPKILDKISQHLNIEPGETSKDLKYSLETVNCLGACARGPLVTINNEYRGNISVGDVESILEEIEGAIKEDENMEGDH